MQHKKSHLKTLKNVLLILVFTVIGCKSERKLDGNYCTCHNGLYAELYIENDSIQSATSLGWISNWREFEIKNDTIYHLYFGEGSKKAKAKIGFKERGGFELYYPMDGVTHSYNKLNLIIENDITSEQFWNEFNQRKIEFDCFTVSERYLELERYFGKENIRIDYSGETHKEVKITHIPSGIVEIETEQKTQVENAIIAMKRIKLEIEKSK